MGGLNGLAHHDCLRYSLVPLERVSSSSIDESDDFRRKCLNELGING